MKKRKAVFLDRDGTIVVHEPYLSSPDQLKLLPNTAEGIRLFREYGYLIIVITNQSGIARGFFDEERLMLIHKKLMGMLEEKGVFVDDLFYCPHHMEGIVERYKMDCDCRKPKPGMLREAARRHQIDLTQSLMIGDSETDMLAGKNAGCRCVLIRNDRIDEISAAPVTGTDYMVKDLLEAARLFYTKNDYQ
ncbi:MAG: HAD family hydrolase [Candidatus Brocadia sp.]|nr:HAD family hydrolase [Candidatus Brocadia sp.]